MIEPDFPAKLEFSRSWRFVSVAASVALLAAFLVGAVFQVAHLA